MAVAAQSLRSASPAPRADRRAEILAAARACFARKGFHGASMQEICAAAGMSPGGLYRYFRAKSDIIEAIAEDEQTECMAILARVATDGPLADRLTEAALAYLVHARRSGAMAIHYEVASECLRDSAIAASFLRAERVLRDSLRDLIAQEAAAGRGPTGLDGEAAVEMLMAVPEGLVMRGVAAPDFSLARLRPFLRAAFAAILTTEDQKACS